MIELITGLPGNGKTLYTIWQVKDRATRENRPVFYHGIAELNVPGWEPLADPKEWAKVPPNSIVVLDEAQKTFRNRSVSAAPPAFVTDLETHRHLGIDLVMITQHPSLIDPAVRRLAGRHQHMVRMWGMEASTVHRWDAVKDNCDKSRADSQKTKWAFDKKIYGLYKSAEVHTMKRSIPARVKLLIAVPFLLAAAGYYVSTIIMHKTKPAELVNAVPGSAASPLVAPGQVGGGAPGQRQAPFDALADARNYMAMSTPRVVGLPQTAPKYDALTVPVRVPVPAACLQVGSVHENGGKNIRCKCYSQQGTPMPVEMNMCIEFARNGYFQDFDADKEKVDMDKSAKSASILQDTPAKQSSSQVVAFNSVPDGGRPNGLLSK